MITLILTLALIGVLTWAVITYLPMPQGIKNLIVIIVIVLIVLYLIRIIGVGDIPIPTIRR